MCVCQNLCEFENLNIYCAHYCCCLSQCYRCLVFSFLIIVLNTFINCCVGAAWHLLIVVLPLFGFLLFDYWLLFGILAFAFPKAALAAAVFLSKFGVFFPASWLRFIFLQKKVCCCCCFLMFWGRDHSVSGGFCQYLLFLCCY